MAQRIFTLKNQFIKGWVNVLSKYFLIQTSNIFKQNSEGILKAL